MNDQERDQQKEGYKRAANIRKKGSRATPNELKWLKAYEQSSPLRKPKANARRLAPIPTFVPPPEVIINPAHIASVTEFYSTQPPAGFAELHQTEVAAPAPAPVVAPAPAPAPETITVPAAGEVGKPAEPTLTGETVGQIVVSVLGGMNAKNREYGMPIILPDEFLAVIGKSARTVFDRKYAARVGEDFEEKLVLGTGAVVVLQNVVGAVRAKKDKPSAARVIEQPKEQPIAEQARPTPTNGAGGASTSDAPKLDMSVTTFIHSAIDAEAEIDAEG